MASPSTIVRAGRLLPKSDPCVFCQARQSLAPRPALRQAPTQNGSSLISARTFGIKVVPREKPVRTGEMAVFEAEVRKRRNTLVQMKAEGLLAMAPMTAENFLEDFKGLPGVDVKKELEELTYKYNIKLPELTMLGHALFSVADITDKAGRVHRTNPSKLRAKELWLAAARADEPSSILHIMNAVHLSATKPGAVAVVRMFSAGEIAECREKLTRLAASKDPDAMTLAGRFLEREGQRKAARELFEEALKVMSLKYEGDSKRSIGLPLTPPWTAAGLMYLSEAVKSGIAKGLAEEAFKKGALEADDPLAYYHLAQFQEKYSSTWLEYMNKAASSGHPDAMYELASFYNNANPKDNPELASALSKDRKLGQSLKWILSWKPEKTVDLADEWLTAAANMGHKLAMWKVVEELEAKDKLKEAESWLRRILTSPPAGKEEEAIVVKARALLNQPGFKALRADAAAATTAAKMKTK